MTLDVAIPTYKRNGLKTFVAHNPPIVEGVRYVLSWQEHENEPIPDSLAKRDDVIVVRFDESGLSANRNNALRNCNAEVVLMGDDDVRYDAAGLKAVIEVFGNNSDIDVAFLRNVPHEKPYPMSQIVVTKRFPKGYYVATPEIAVRRDKCHDFDLNFGPGAESFSAGEDSKWAIDALQKGLQCVMLPITVGEHKAITLGNRPFSDPGIAMASGAIIRLEHNISWPVRLLIKAYRFYKAGQCPFLFALKNLIKGASLANNYTS